jgi:drug/metabolite transporter (DMT)-like permease
MAGNIPLLIWVSAVVSVFLSAVGQYLMKTGMSRAAVRTALNQGLITGAARVATELHVLGGVACYGVSMAIWLICLSRMPLTVAYPLVSLSLVIVIGLSVFLGGERINLVQSVGIMLIIAGVLLVGRR